MKTYQVQLAPTDATSNNNPVPVEADCYRLDGEFFEFKIGEEIVFFVQSRHVVWIKKDA